MAPTVGIAWPDALWHTAGVRIRAVDIVCLAYVLLIGALLLPFGGMVEDRAWLLLAHLLVAAAILALVWRGGESPSTGWRYARTLYPIVLLLLAWEELDSIVPMLYAGDYWVTDLAVRADLALFGSHPTVAIQQLHRPWLDELMAIFYTGYYLFLTVPLVLLVQRKYEAAVAAMGIIALNYFTNFTTFLLLPVKSPPQILGDYPGLRPSGYTGYAVAALTRAIQNNESVLGAAFPSSHVSGSFVCSLLALRFAPGFGRVLLPLSLGVAVSTVYLGYHHAVDPIAGLAWGGASYALGMRWLASRGELP